MSWTHENLQTSGITIWGRCYYCYYYSYFYYYYYYNYYYYY